MTGTGYVDWYWSLFAETGNSVGCVDIDEVGLPRCETGKIPIYGTEA